MKLKKIASLMLAGIMAVSMLAGCGEGKGNSSSSSSSSTPATSSILSLIEEKVKVENSDLTVSYKNSDPMNAALDKLASDVNNTYGVLMGGQNPGSTKIKPVLENVFAGSISGAFMNLNDPTNAIDFNNVGNNDTFWYYRVIGDSAKPDNDVRYNAAYTIAGYLKNVENSYVKGTNNMSVSVDVYAHEISATKTDGTKTPIVVVVIKASAKVASV